MRVQDVFYRIPFLPIFLFSYVGIVLSDIHVEMVLAITALFFVMFVILRAFDFLPIVALTLIFFFYTKSLSKTGRFFVGTVDSLSPSSVLISVKSIKEDVVSSWKNAGGYVRIFGSKKLQDLDVFDKVVGYCKRLQDIRPGWRLCSSPVFIERVERGVILSLLYGLRRRSRELVKAYDEEGKILDSILFGGREEIDQKFLYDLSRFGVLHLVAISGSHFTAVAFLGTFLANFVGRFLFGYFQSVRFQPYVLKITFSFIFQLIFLCMCGMIRPAQRAFIMNTVFFMLYLSGRKFSPINALFASAFFIIVINPFDIWNISFVLSFLAVLFILSFTPPEGTKVSALFQGSVFASLGVLPVLVYLGVPVSLVAPVTNIVFTFLFNLVILSGVLGVFIGNVFYPLSVLPIIASKLLIKTIIILTDVFGFAAVAVRPKVELPYEIGAILIFSLLMLLKRFNRAFLYLSFVTYLIFPTALHFATREKIYTFSVFLIREVRGTEGKKFYILPMRENISERQVERLYAFLKREKARCATFCFSDEELRPKDIPMCELYQKCDFGNIRS